MSMLSSSVFRLSHFAAKIIQGMILLFAVFGFSASLRAESVRSGGDRNQWQREDIAVFRDEFLAIDRAFTPEARKQALRRLSRLEEQAIGPAEFAVELCRIAALADNGHTQCLPNWLGRDICQGVVSIGFDRTMWCQSRTPDFEIPDPSSVPIAFFAFGTGFNVVGVEVVHSDLLGARLIAVEGRPIERIVATLRTFAGGTSAHRDDKAVEVLASPEQLHAVGLSRNANSVEYTLLTVDNKRLSRVFSTHHTAQEGAWHRLPRRAGSGSSWAFQEPQEPFRYRDAPEIDSAVVQLRKTFDDGSRRITDFLEAAETKRRNLGRKHVVLDMRFNGGGNFLLVRDFMARWPKRVPGRFFVLTSRQTFSAAIAAIAYLKQAGEGRVTIVGEPVGDRMMFFSDGLPIQLPHSGRYFQPAVVRMDYHDGCRIYDDCQEAIGQPGRPVAASVLPMLGPVTRMPVAVPSLEPDVIAPWTIDAWRNDKDPMMDAIPAALGD